MPPWSPKVTVVGSGLAGLEAPGCPMDARLLSIRLETLGSVPMAVSNVRMVGKPEVWLPYCLTKRIIAYALIDGVLDL